MDNFGAYSARSSNNINMRHLISIQKVLMECTTHVHVKAAVIMWLLRK